MSIFWNRAKKSKPETLSFLDNSPTNDNLVGDRELSTHESTKDFFKKYNEYYKIDPNQFLYKKTCRKRKI